VKAFPIPLVRATCAAHFILFDLLPKGESHRGN
jgi:hypothetical protein